MNPDYVKKAIAEIEASQDKQRGDPLLYRLILLIYDEMGIQTETFRHIIDAIYDLAEEVRGIKDAIIQLERTLQHSNRP